MTFCVNCGREIPDDYAFCPNCGARRFQEPDQAVPAEQPVAYRTPASPKTTGRVRGLGIASMAVGIEGMVLGIFFSFYALMGLMASLATDDVPVGEVFGAVAMIFSLIGLASGIVASILSRKALAEKPDFRFGVLGKGFGLAATIVSGAAIFIGLLALVF